MVLTEDLAKERLEETKDIYLSQIMFFDTRHMEYKEDTTKFGWGVEVLNQINFISWANKLCSDLGSNRKLDGSILYEVINAVYNDTPFNDEQLTRYFELGQNMESLFTVLLKWHDIDRYYTPYELDYFLLGMPFEFIDGEANLSELSEGYGGINIDMRFKKIKINDFIEKAKKLVGKPDLT